jgi:sacsin
VRGLTTGDLVCAVTQGGAFAEEVVAPALCTVKLPASCDAEAAAGLPVAFGTAYLALRDRANVKPGQTVLVLGAAGGVGLAAVQLARVMGAKVVAVARGAAKMEALRGAGADACVDMAGRRPEQLPALVRAAAPGGVDVVFDPVGGAVFTQALRCVRWGAQLLIIGFAAGVPPIPANIALVKNLTVHGIYWGAHMQHRPAAFRRSLDAVAAMYAAGDVTVHVSHRYALEQAAEAFAVLMNRGVVGKLLLVSGPRSARL